MDGTQRLGRNRRSRRSRSQRDRERKLAGVAGRDPRPYTPSSGSDQERAEGPCSSRPRPPRRRRRESTSCEEDIIDGFAIASFVSLETLEREAVLKPPERTEAQQKRPEKRRPEEQGSSSPGEGPRRNECPDPEQTRQNGEQDGRRAPPAKKVKTKVQSRGNESTGGENGSSYRSSSRGPGSDESVHSSLGTGYFCDIDSDPDDKSISEDPVRCPKREVPSASSHSLSTRWKSTLFGASDEGLSKLFSTASKIAPSVRGSADPRPETQVSGLERSQERNQESEQAVLPAGPPNPHPQPPPPPQLQPPTPPQSAAQPGHDPSPPKLSQGQGQSQPVPPPAQPGPQALVPPQHQTQARLQPFTQNYSGGSRSSTPSKPLAPSSQVPHRASTPSSLGLSSHPSTHVFASGLRTPAHPHHPAVFAPSPGLPPPPPLNSTMLQVAGHPSPAAAATFSEQELIRQELNSRYLSSQGPERGSSLGPPSFQFHQHQHSHQHTHQHTHQHFAPYPPMAQAGLVPAPTAPMYFQTYHTACPTVPAVLSTAGPFSSLQGAFQPKNPSAELASRPGPVPHTLLRKDPRLTEVYRPPVRKPGKWCAMHVRIAWMIHRHQEKNKVEHQKLDLAKADLLSRGPSVFSPVAPTHDLARPITLFTATGAVHSATPPFGPPTALSPFLSTSSPLDPYSRSPTYGPIGQIPNAAFGGLGNPAVASAIFAPKECPSSAAPPPSYSSSRDQWSHLHQTPPAFPTPPPTWARLGEAERERGLISEKDKREVLLLKEEQESREGPYSRHPFRTPVEERLPTPLERRAPPLPQRVKPEPSRGDQPRPRDRPETGGVGGGVGKEEVEGGGCPFPGLRAVPLPLIVSPGSPAELSLLPPHLLRLGQPHHPPYPWDPWVEAVPLQARRCPPPPTEREREREPTAQRHSLLQEEYEQRARLLAGGFLPTPPHPYPRLSPSLLRQSTLLPKTPPLGGPPPLISSSSSSATSSSTRALSPRQRGAPASDLRDLPPPSSTYPHRERDAR